MAPNPPSSRSFALNLPIRCSGIHLSRSRWRQGVRNGLRAAGAAALSGGAVGWGLALSGSRPMGRVSNSIVGRAAGSDRNSPSTSSSPLLPHLTLTNGLILVNALLFGAQVLTKDALTLQGAKVNALISAGQYWRFLTPAFLHGNIMHLAVNCYSLYNLAPMVETLSGSKRLLAVYLAAAVTGNVASFLGSTAPSLGASGAVFGVGGALGMYFYQNKELWGKKADYMLKSLWQTLLMNLLYGLANPRIDNWGHMGGLFGGAAVAYLVGPRLKLRSHGGKKYLVDQPPVGLLASPPRQIGR